MIYKFSSGSESSGDEFWQKWEEKQAEIYRVDER